MPHLEPTYLRYIYDGLLKGSIHPENAAELPEGLIGLYEEALDERNSVVERQKLLERFAIWALLKKEVSAGFVAEVLGETEDDIQEFISTYSAWFNSPESGKYQLYHERLKLYLLQKLSEGEFHSLHEKLILRLEQAIEEQKADEFEWYGLEFLGELYFSNFDDKLFEISCNKIYQDRQVFILGDFRIAFKNLELSILLAKSRNDRKSIVKASTEKLKIRKRFHENFDLLYGSINNNHAITSNLLGHYNNKTKGLVSVLLFHEFFEGDLQLHPLKSLFIHLIMEDLSSIEDDPVKRGWLLSVPEIAQDLYLHELNELDIDDFHFRKLIQFITNDDDLEYEFNFNESISLFNDDIETLEDKTEDFNFANYLDDSDQEVPSFLSLDTSENPFESLSMDDENEFKAFLASMGDNNIDFDSNKVDIESNLRPIHTFEERKLQLINELNNSSNKWQDLIQFSKELIRLKENLFLAEIRLQLLLSISDFVKSREFNHLYHAIIQELTERKQESNPIVFSHEVKACCEVLLEQHFYTEALELIPFISQSEMRDDLYSSALHSSYDFDKEIYANVLKNACQIHKLDTSIYINKGELIREFILQGKTNELNDIFSSSDSFFLTMLCGGIIEDDRLFIRITDDYNLLKVLIPAFKKTINHSLQGFSEIFQIHCDLQNGEIPLSEKDFQALCEQINKVDNKEEFKKLYSCLYLFSQNEQITAFILSQFNSMLKDNKKIISEILQDKNEHPYLFKSTLIIWKRLNIAHKEKYKSIFNEILNQTKNNKLNERSACIFLINKELGFEDPMFSKQKLELSVPILFLKNGYVEEAIEIATLCKDSNPAIIQLEFWIELLEHKEDSENLVNNFMNFVNDKFEVFSEEISIEDQSFVYVPLFARALNKLYEFDKVVEFKSLFQILLNHIESLSVSLNEKRKLLYVFSFSINFNVFKYILCLANKNQQLLLASSLSFLKGYHKNIQDKILEELCVIRDDADLVENALLHLSKCDHFYSDLFDTMNETSEIFNFEYWLTLKSPK